MIYRVVLTAPAKDDLLEIRAYIRQQSSQRIASTFTRDLVAECRSLAVFPMRGTVRTEIGPDHRLVTFRGRVTIHFRVKSQTVTILALIYAGWDWQQDMGSTSVD